MRRTRNDRRVEGILAELRGLGSERDRAGMARYGINVENAFGVSVYQLRKIAKRLVTFQHEATGWGQVIVAVHRA